MKRLSPTNTHKASRHTARCAYLAALLISLCPPVARSQQLAATPRLVVSITIDQLRSDYLEYFAPLYGSDGFRRLLTEGRVYSAAHYPFMPVDRASAITCVATGATPQYNKIIAQQWFSRDNMKTSYCVYDKKYVASPANIASSTVSDELKVSTDGKALVYGVAQQQDAAILSVGHAADGAYWLNDINGVWSTSSYYPNMAQVWLRAYNAQHSATKKIIANEEVATLALTCIVDNGLGRDDITDYLSITLSAGLGVGMGQRNEMQSVYTSLDKTVGNFISNVEARVGKDKVLFVLTSTGAFDEPTVDYDKYKIPTGTFYINRTAQLLNMYLSAIYGSGVWVEAYYKNQIFLNHRLIDSRKTNYSEIIQRSKDLLHTASGVAAVLDSPYDTTITGDLWIDVNPGWKIRNEETNETYQINTTFIPFPVIFYGANVAAGHIDTEITTDYIAPTIAKAIRIRAPNACKTTPLF